MKHTHIILLSLALLASCSSEAPENPMEEMEQVTSISVVRQQYKAAPGILETKADDNDASAEDPNAPIIISSFQKGSKLYISQQGPTSFPNFTNQENGNPCYVYEYNQKAADWDNKYNFSLPEGGTPFDWATVKKIGSVGNAFSLYAFHFPGDEPKFSVMADQGKKENFIKSDIMGAYHATSSLYTRLRFRLFHLMVYLKVTLYVPVYQDENTDKDKKYSGYHQNALQGAYVMNANTDFSIEWTANRSSDTNAPLTQTSASDNKENITMYRHTPEKKEAIKNFPVTEYYKPQEDDPEIDEVWEYNFSVLFPSQAFGDKFLCFELKAPDDSPKYYYFSGSQVMGTSTYGLTQGTLQHLSLYLPRKTNETILVGANILPWSEGVTDMTVIEGDNTEDDNDEESNQDEKGSN